MTQDFECAFRVTRKRQDLSEIIQLIAYRPSKGNNSTDQMRNNPENIVLVLTM